MSDLAYGAKLAQELDYALAAYQRHHGRAKTLERLRFMLQRAEAAQRLLDDGYGSLNGKNPKAAE